MMNLDAKKAYSIVAAFLNVAIVWYVVKLPMTPDALEWHYNLLLSPINPPGYVFGIVWSILYGLTFLALANIMMNQAWFSTELMFAKITYWINSALCIWWSYTYWGHQNISLSYFIMLAIFIYSFVMTWAFYKASKTAGYLMIPKVIWYGFATYLSWYIWMNN